jgi:hypothetical protein
MYELLVVALVAFLIGYIVRIVIARLINTGLRDNTAMQEHLQDVAHEFLDRIVFLRIEEHTENIYAYNAMTDEFICQGKNMDDLNINFSKRCPNKKGILIKPDEGEAIELVQPN